MTDKPLTDKDVSLMLERADAAREEGFDEPLVDELAGDVHLLVAEVRRLRERHYVIIAFDIEREFLTEKGGA